MSAAYRALAAQLSKASPKDLQKFIAEARKTLNSDAKHKGTFGSIIFGKVKANPNISTKRLAYEMRNVRTTWGNTTPEPNTIVTYRSMARSFLRAQGKKAKAA